MSSDPYIGQQLGDYIVQELLGKGGMARVYRAIDPNLNRTVAIKVIDPGVAEDPDYTLRFKREAQAVAKLSHPNIVSIFQFGLVGRTYYMAMAFIDGFDLEQYINNLGQVNQVMPFADILKVIGQMASALDYAHGQGVIHRDVKASNIMINKQGRAFLTDFGLVRDMDIPTMGEIFGSPETISPEQAINSAYAVPNSDQYSLGVVTYQMLCGQLPFHGTHPNDIAMKHIEETPPSLHKLNPAIPPQLEAVVMRALRKNPEERYASVTEFFNAFRAAVKANGG